MAVSPGVRVSAPASGAKAPGEAGIVGLFTLLFESWVTGRMVAPLKSGELDVDLGDRGVKGLGPSELKAPGERGEESLPLFEFDLDKLRSSLGTVEFRDGILGENRRRPTQRFSKRGCWLVV